MEKQLEKQQLPKLVLGIWWSWYYYITGRRAIKRPKTKKTKADLWIYFLWSFPDSHQLPFPGMQLKSISAVLSGHAPAVQSALAYLLFLLSFRHATAVLSVAMQIKFLVFPTMKHPIVWGGVLFRLSAFRSSDRIFHSYRVSPGSTEYR